MWRIKFYRRRRRTSPVADRKKYLEHKEAARTLALERVEYFSNVYQVPVKKISIRDQKTCWGSCSTKGNLNFNYKIVLISSRLADYIIVHELCHLKEFNHSARFWNLVALVFPDHLEIRQELRNPNILKKVV